MRLVWFGHSTFRLEFGGKVVLIDPFLTANPAFSGDPAAASEGATHVLITHGHGDHIGDALAIAERTGAVIVANYEICTWLAGRGARSVEAMNTGGTIAQDGFTVSMVRADHSSTMVEGDVLTALGLPGGLIVKAPGEPVVYHMGDTDLFGDMALIAELHQPDILLVPIGDRFTMGPDNAALAVRRYFQPRAVVPCHYGSCPPLVANADGFVSALEGSGVQVLTPHIGMGVTL